MKTQIKASILKIRSGAVKVLLGGVVAIGSIGAVWAYSGNDSCPAHCPNIDCSNFSNGKIVSTGKCFNPETGGVTCKCG
jgi:hypothetical protein